MSLLFKFRKIRYWIVGVGVVVEHTLGIGAFMDIKEEKIRHILSSMIVQSYIIIYTWRKGRDNQIYIIINDSTYIIIYTWHKGRENQTHIVINDIIHNYLPIGVLGS